MAEARIKHSEFKRMVTQGKSPAKIIQAQKTARLESDQFAEFALDWVDKVHSQNNKIPERAKQILIKDINPFIGHKNIANVTQSDILKILDTIQERGADKAAIY